MKKTLLTIVGPTAIGKTSLAISLAEYYNTVILSADSRQFYQEMSIGTAVPSQKELNSVKHYFIHHKSVEDFYTVGDFEKDCIEIVHKLFAKHDIVILVGGSGLYINAVLYGLNSFPGVNKNIRYKLNTIFKEKGIEYLQKELKEQDPTYYDKVDLQNPQRIIRALEISLGTGKPYSSYLTPELKERSFKSVLVGLNAERDVIYERINSRVDKMVEMGLFQEVEGLLAYRKLNALQTVGYKEIFNFFDGSFNKETAIEEIKKNTRRFAKRQLNWFKKDPNAVWFDYKTDINSIIETIDSKISESSR